MTDAAIVAAMRSEMPDDEELRESLRHFGWVEQFPAIQDEHGTTLVGNRRIRIAQEIGIKPVIMSITVGDGEEANSTRFRLAIVSNLGGKSMSVAERKKLAIYLYQHRQWTMQRIGDALGRTKKTVGEYLDGIVFLGDNRRVQKKGRPRGHKYSPTVEQTAAKRVLDDGKSVRTVAKEIGVSEQTVIRSMQEERGYRRALADPPIDRADLSKTAQEKFDAAIRQYKAKLDLEFEDRVRAECLKRDEVWLANELEVFAKARKIESLHNGVMTADEFRTIQRCLHTDVLAGIAKQGEVDKTIARRFDHAASIVNGLKPILIKEVTASTMPTREEMMRRRAEVYAKRSAQSKASAAKRKNGGAEAQ